MSTLDYVNLNIPCFTRDILTGLISHVSFEYDWVVTENNEEVWPKLIYGKNFINNASTKLVKKFSDDILIDWVKNPVLCVTKPNSWIHKHSDNFGILSKIIIPILPVNNLQPFMYHNDDGTVELVNMKVYQPILVDVNRVHGGFTTNNSTRISLQFTFRQPVSKIVQLIIKNKFTKTFECNICRNKY